MAKITCTLSAKVDKQTGKSEILLRMQNRKMGNRRAHSRVWVLPQFMNEKNGEIEIKARKLTPEVKEAYVQKSKLDKLKNPKPVNLLQKSKKPMSKKANSTNSKTTSSLWNKVRTWH